jgi:hypothetical protein
MKKELNIISMEGEILLKDNLVRSSILPHTSSELERNVTILADAIVEGAVYANKLQIESGETEIRGAVYTKLELHVDTGAKGKVVFMKSVASSDSVTSYAKDCDLMFMADINAKKVRLNHAFIAGSIYADEIQLEDCIIIGGVFSTKSIDLKNCVVGTFNSNSVFLEGANYLLLPSAFCGSPIEVAADAKLYNLSLADLGAIYKGTSQMQNTGVIEMDAKTDELKTMLSEDHKTMLVYSYSIAGKVLATDLVDFERLQNHFLIGATAMGSQILRKYDLGTDADGNKAIIEPDKVAKMFFDILHGTAGIQQIDGTFSIQDLASKIPGVI